MQWTNYNKFSLYVLLCVALFFVMHSSTYADHQGPERAVEGKFTVILSIVPQDDNSQNLRFFFRNLQTGKSVSNVVPTISITTEDGDILLEDQLLEVENGTAELIYAFPVGGLYEIFLEFYEVENPEKIYKPDEWPVWLSGKDGSGVPAPYIFGLSEMLGTALAVIAVVVVIWSFIHNRKKSVADNI